MIALRPGLPQPILAGNKLTSAIHSGTSDVPKRRTGSRR